MVEYTSSELQMIKKGLEVKQRTTMAKKDKYQSTSRQSSERGQQLRQAYQDALKDEEQYILNYRAQGIDPLTLKRDMDVNRALGRELNRVTYSKMQAQARGETATRPVSPAEPKSTGTTGQELFARSGGGATVVNPYSQTTVNVARAGGAKEAFYAAGYRPPVQVAQLNLERQKETVFKRAGYLPKVSVRGEGTEDAGTIKVYKQTITAQNDAEARLAGLPTTGKYDVVGDVRTYKAQETVLDKANRAVAPVIAGSPLGKASIKLETFGRNVREANALTAEKFRPNGGTLFEQESVKGAAKEAGTSVVFTAAKFAEFSGGFVETVGQDVRGRPVEVGVVAGSGALLKVADTGVVALRGSKALAGTGLAARTARGAITTARVGTGTVLVGGFAAGTAVQVAETKGDTGALSRVAARTTEDVLAFGAGMKGAKAILEPPAKVPTGPVLVNVRTKSPRLVTSSPSINQVPANIPTVTLVETGQGKLTAVESIAGKNRQEVLASAMQLGSRRAGTSGEGFSPSSQTSITLSYARNYPGIRGLFSRPETVTVRVKPSGAEQITVSSPGKTTVTRQDPGAALAVQEVFKTRVEARPLPQRPGLQEVRTLVSSRQVPRVETFGIAKESLAGKPVNAEARSPQTGTVVQEFRGRESTTLGIELGGKYLEGTGSRVVRLKEVGQASPASVVQAGKLLGAPESGRVRITARRSAKSKVQTRLSIGEDAAAKNEYAVSLNPDMTLPEAKIDTGSLRTLAKEGKLVAATAEVRPRSVMLKTVQKSTTASRELSLSRKGTQTFTAYLQPAARPAAAAEPTFKLKEPKKAKGKKTDYSKLTAKLEAQRTEQLLQGQQETQFKELTVQEAALDRLVNVKPSGAATKQPTPKTKALPLTGKAKEAQGFAGESFSVRRTERQPAAKARSKSPINKAREELGLDTSTKPSIKVSPISGQGRAQRSRESFRQLDDTTTKPALAVESIQRQEQPTKQEQRQRLDTARAQLPRQVQRQRLRIPIPKVPTKILPPAPKSGREKGGPFSVLMRRKGKFKKVGTGLSAEEALKLGKESTEQTLAASFKVQGPQGEKLQLREAAGVLGGRYRTAKKDSTIFVQKAPFRLSSRNERQEIRQSKKSGLARLFS